MTRAQRRVTAMKGMTGGAMHNNQLWLAPVRNMTWVSAHFGHR
jgi:hypothetical protein